MPDSKISQLPADTSVSGSEIVPVVDASLTPPNRRTTTSAIADLVTKARIGLSNVDNTSDVNKPVSTATQDALAGKANTGAIGSSGLTMATLRILGRTTAGDGAVELISVVGATLAGQTLTITGATDLSYDPATRTVASSTGADAVLTLADGVNAGLMSSADYLKLLSLTFGVLPVPVYNNTNATIAKGVPVYVTGSSGTRITIAPADASAEATAARTLGLTSAAIASNADGTVIAVGELTGLNTSTLAEGQIIWLSETTGAMTTTRPTQPAHGVVLGYCVKQGAGSSGIIYVKVDNGLEIDELHDVLIAGKATGQALMLAADGLWKNRLLIAADLSDSSATGRSVLTAVDQAAGRTAIGAEQAGAAAAAQAFAIQRGNHTGTQPVSTITGLAAVATSGAYADLSGRFDPTSPGTIGGATPAAGTFTAGAFTQSLLLPSAAPGTPAAGHIYRSANTLRYRDSGGAERLLLNAQDNLANLADTATARANLGAASTAAFTSSAAGLVPASSGGTTNYLRADGTFVAPPGGSPGGTSGQLQWNNGGAFAGVSTTSVDGSGNLTFTGRWIQSTNGVASAPPMSLTGTWFTGGTATTTKPQFLIEPAGATSNSWSTAGTGLGVNAASGFSGNLLDLQVNGTRQFQVSSTGIVACNGLRATAGLASVDSSAILFGPSTNNSVDIALGRSGGTGYLALGQFGFSDATIVLSSNAVIGFSSSASVSGFTAFDAAFRRDTANTLAQRNGTAAQSSRIYNTFTSTTSFERLNIRWTGNEAIIDTEAGSGGGTLRGLKIGSASTSLLGFYGATPVDRPAAVADATDNASAITQLNLALARLRSLGLIAT